MSEKKDAEEYYDTVAEEYDREEEEPFFILINELAWSQIKEALAPVKGGKVLDAGGGTGKWSILLSKEGFDVTMTDISDKMIKIAEKKAKKAGVADKMTFQRADLSKLEFEDGLFDAVLCEGEVLSCIDYDAKDQVIGEMARVLKKGGKLIVSAGNRYFFALYFLRESTEAAKNLLTAPTINAPDNPKSPLYSRTELEKLLEKHSISVEKTIGAGVLTLPYVDHLRGKPLEKGNLDHLKEIERILCQMDGIKEIAPSIRVIGTKQ